MNANELKELYDAQPFEPFEIVLPNGSTVPVEHPKFMAFSPGYKTIHVYPMAGDARHIDVKMIVEVRQVLQNRRSKKTK